jgi:membrane protein
MAKKYNHGILVVHGIGHQRKGETLEEQGKPIIESIKNIIDSHSLYNSESNIITKNEEDKNKQKIPKAYEYEYSDIEENKNSILVEEACWSPPQKELNELVEEEHLKWVLKNVKILSLITAFHRNNTKNNVIIDFLNNIFYFIWSITKFIFLLGLTGFIFNNFLLIIIVLIMVFFVFNKRFSLLLFLKNLSFTRPPRVTSLINRVYNKYIESPSFLVQIASDKKSEHRKTYEGIILKKIKRMSRKCEYISIISHSQGGFLTYEVLSNEEALRNVLNIQSFYGVGSGLNPIKFMESLNLLKLFKLPIVFSIFVLTTIYCISYTISSGLVLYVLSIVIYLMVNTLRIITIPDATFENFPDLPKEFLNPVNDNIFAHPYIYIIYSFLLIGYSLYYSLLKRKYIKNNTSLHLLKPDSIKEKWCEVTDPTDIVGYSNLLLPNNSVEEKYVYSEGFSHTNYYKKSSLLPDLIARDVIKIDKNDNYSKYLTKGLLKDHIFLTKNILAFTLSILLSTFYILAGESGFSYEKFFKYFENVMTGNNTIKYFMTVIIFYPFLYSFSSLFEKYAFRGSRQAHILNKVRTGALKINELLYYRINKVKTFRFFINFLAVVNLVSFINFYHLNVYNPETTVGNIVVVICLSEFIFIIYTRYNGRFNTFKIYLITSMATSSVIIVLFIIFYTKIQNEYTKIFILQVIILQVVCFVIRIIITIFCIPKDTSH